MQVTKICSSCGNEFELDAFRKHPKTKDGRKYECIDCDNERQRQYYLKNAEKKKAMSRAYKEDNKEDIAEYNREYYLRRKGANGNDS